MAATSSVPQPKTYPAVIAACAAAGVTFRFVIPPDEYTRGLVNFDSPATKGSTLCVPLRNCTPASIQARIDRWLKDNAAALCAANAYTPGAAEDDMERAVRG